MTGRKRGDDEIQVRGAGIVVWKPGRVITPVFRCAEALGRLQFSASYLGRLTVFAVTFLMLSGLVFSPGGSAKPQYPPVYENEAPSYEPGYHQSEHGYSKPVHYPHIDDDPWPSFGVILLIIILIVLIVALFYCPLRTGRRDVVLVEINRQFVLLRSAHPHLAPDLFRAETAIIGRLDEF